MKKYFFIISFCALSSSFAVGPNTTLLTFLNGNNLQGCAVAAEPTKLYWKSEALGIQGSFFLSQIKELTLPAPVAAKSEAKHLAHVRFNPDLRQQNQKLSGDSLYGALVDVTETSIILDTWYAGRLTIDRNMVSQLEIQEMQPPLYSGPTGESDWKADPRKSWIQEDGKLVMKEEQGFIGRDFKEMPESFCLSFFAEWNGHFSLQLTFCANDLNSQKPDDGYILFIDASQCHLRRDVRGIQPQLFAGMMGDDGPDTSSIREKEKSQFKLYVDRSTGKIVLFSDETLIHEWQDTSPKCKGKMIHFQPYSSRNQRQRISQIVMTKWDGILNKQKDEKPNPITNPEPAKGEQRIRLRNGDIALGSVQKIAEGTVQLKTRFGDLSLPIERITDLKLPPPEYNERLLQNGDIRCWFPDGHHITFRLESITPQGKWKGYAQNFGEAEFDISAFSKIEFNLYPPLVKN
jgi:hypothetical protein